MDTSKIIRAVVGHGRYTTTEPITQWDYGYVLRIEGTILPATYRVDFSNDREHGEALPVYGDETGAEVPEELIATGKDVFAFYVHIEEGFARTAHTWRIPNHLRAKAGDREPTPSQQNSIDQAIAALNTAIEKTSADAEQTGRDAEATARDAERAEAARDQSVTAKDAAVDAAGDAGRYASAAERSAEAANLDKQDADRYARAAGISAERAEQAANTAGWVDFYIDDDGYLHYVKADSVGLDFYVDADGYLHVVMED